MTTEHPRLVAVADDERVVETRNALAIERARLEAFENELQRAGSIRTHPFGDIEPSEVERWLTETHRRIADQQLIIAAWVEREGEAVRDAQTRLEKVRREQRKPLVQDVLRALKEAEESARRLQAFDKETIDLGGSSWDAPCPQLLLNAYALHADRAKERGWL
jgi:hypothetical protein